MKNYSKEYKPILMARGGVTGISQVNGASGLPYLKELELDSSYIKNMTVSIDLKIIAKTLKIILIDPTAV